MLKPICVKTELNKIRTFRRQTKTCLSRFYSCETDDCCFLLNLLSLNPWNISKQHNIKLVLTFTILSDFTHTLLKHTHTYTHTKHSCKDNTIVTISMCKCHSALRIWEVDQIPLYISIEWKCVSKGYSSPFNHLVTIIVPACIFFFPKMLHNRLVLQILWSGHNISNVSSWKLWGLPMVLLLVGWNCVLCDAVSLGDT